LVHEIPEQDNRVRKPKHDSATMFSPKLVAAFISLGWLPAGLLGLFIAERLPLDVRLPFYALMIVAIIYYRFDGAQRLRRKWMQRSKH
jgi:hypothetical protein